MHIIIYSYSTNRSCTPITSQITKNLRRKANAHASVWGPGTVEVGSTRVMRRIRINDANEAARVGYAFDFALLHLQRTAHGSKILTISTGERIECPAGLLDGLVEEIVDAYIDEVEHRGSVPIARAHMETILHAIGGGKDQMLAALDSVYFKCCLETFKRIRILIGELAVGREELGVALVKESHIVENFLRKEYHTHLQETATCSNHSFSHALELHATATHTHICRECDAPYVFLANVKRAIQTCSAYLHADCPDDEASFLRYFEKQRCNIDTFIGHVIRKKHEELAEQKVSAC